MSKYYKKRYKNIVKYFNVNNRNYVSEITDAAGN